MSSAQRLHHLFVLLLLLPRGHQLKFQCLSNHLRLLHGHSHPVVSRQLRQAIFLCARVKMDPTSILVQPVNQRKLVSHGPEVTHVLFDRHLVGRHTLDMVYWNVVLVRDE